MRAILRTRIDVTCVVDANVCGPVCTAVHISATKSLVLASYETGRGITECIHLADSLPDVYVAVNQGIV